MAKAPETENATGRVLVLSTTVLGTMLSAAVVILACSGDAGVGSLRASSSGAGSSSGFAPGTPDAGPAPACVAKEAEAAPGKRPVDIVFIVDNSESMTEEIAEVEDQINTNFASIIEASDIDYRVVMLSHHGAHDPVGPDGGTAIQRICVKAPLSGTTCSPIPAQPAETARFVHHDVIINSTDGFCQVLQTFNGPDRNGSHPQGWAAYLRPVAFKVFAIFTDDRVSTACNGFTFDDKSVDPISGTASAETFDSALLALSQQFGTAARRNYVWHSIIGVAPFDSGDLTKPHPPDAPIVTEKCGADAIAPATGYQALSKLTGGLRYPTCGHDYTTIFKAMAKDVIDSSILACDYAMPPSPAEGKIDPATAVVRYTSGAAVTDFGRVADATTCGPDKFYIEGDRIKLCADACSKIRNDIAAEVKILFNCLPREQK